MKALVTGAAGQLGRELLRHAPGEVQVQAATRDELDITNLSAVDGYMAAQRPDIVLNAAAFTDVDRAEREPEQAREVNALGPGILAQACVKFGARLVHVSSDYVFDGQASAPYRPTDIPAPLNVYGRTKREGELAVLEAHPRALVLRSAWLYSARGKNFVKAILLMARAGRDLRVVADQVGSPTWAAGLAAVMWRLAARSDVAGILHHADAGRASWYDFALAIVEQAAACGILPEVPPVVPITSREYGAPARRPLFSELDSSQTRALLGDESNQWPTNLRRMFDEMVSEHA